MAIAPVPEETSGLVAASSVDRTFEAFVFDWDGTAVPDRQAEASAVRHLIEELCATSAEVVVVSGTHVGNVDGQLLARPSGPGHLHLCLNRGSEVFEVGPDGPSLVWRREASTEEDAALDAAAALTVERLAALGVEARIVSQRLNRRKIDIIPLPEWADPPKAAIDRLLEAVQARLTAAGITGLPAVVALAESAAREAGLPDPRITSDVKHVEIGLTDKTDSARWAFDYLTDLGIGPGLALVGGDEFGPLGGVRGSDDLMRVPELSRAVAVSVGVEPGGVPDGVVHLPGGPITFLQLLAAQLQRRRDGRTPWIDEDPAWVVPLPTDPRLERAGESLGALANGRAGLRAAREEEGPGTEPLFVVGGIYTDEENPKLLPVPLWTELMVRPENGSVDRRLVDLRTGLLARERAGPRAVPLRTLRFVSLARPHALALRAEGSPSLLCAGADLTGPVEGASVERATIGGATVVRARANGHGVTVAASTTQQLRSGRRMIERLGAWAADAQRAPSHEEAAALLAEVSDVGFDRLLAEHRRAWAARWRDADIRIEGDDDAQLAARLAVFHLLASVADDGEAAVGARGLSGPAYGGHVFWDADVFTLPALAAIRPGAARAMLEYRVRRLGAARAAASRLGLAGARFPWESAVDGHDVTPRFVHAAGGQVVPIRTGQHEEHIDADVAWAACHYADWSGDDAFLAGAGGRDLLLETARYWASRARVDRAGRAHLYGVIGPDEYHEIVDDNAYTNVMARWNLRCAARLADERGGAAPEEIVRWRTLADALVDGYDADRGVYEQFAGYWRLEPLLMADVAPTPVAVDVLLGHDRVAGSQLIKQADVLMLHHLVPNEVVDGSLAANLDFYEPRTAHGSSLSPAIHAALLARAGQTDRALEMFRLAARLDLDDLTGTSAGGVHLATMGGVWQALAFGFLGLQAGDGVLSVDPHLPAAWTSLEMRFRFRGDAVVVRAAHDGFTFRCTRPHRLRLANGTTVVAEPPSSSFPTVRKAQP